LQQAAAKKILSYGPQIEAWNRRSADFCLDELNLLSVRIRARRFNFAGESHEVEGGRRIPRQRVNFDGKLRFSGVR
jgi:hypothetical protein